MFLTDIRNRFWSFFQSAPVQGTPAPTEMKEMTFLSSPVIKTWSLVLKWIKNQHEISIYELDGKFKCEVLETTLNSRWETPFSMPSELKGLEIPYLSNCEPQINGFRRIHFEALKVHQIWTNHLDEIRLLQINDDLIFQLFDKTTKLITYTSIENAKIFNKGLTKYHFEQIYKTSSADDLTCKKDSEQFNSIDQMDFVPLSIFLKYINSNIRNDLLLHNQAIPEAKTTSLQNFMRYLKNCEPMKIEKINGALKTIFLKKPVTKSLFNRECYVDQDTFAVTLLNTGRSGSGNPFSLEGHGALMIEGLREDSSYFLYCADFMQGPRLKGFTSGIARLRQFVTSEKSQRDLLKKQRGDTWSKERIKVEKMLTKILSEINEPTTPDGRPKICFEVGGAYNLIAKNKAKKYHLEFHNCITWINKKLEMLDLFPKYNLNDQVIASPKRHAKKKRYTELTES